jgi:hypothetical protein
MSIDESPISYERFVECLRLSGLLDDDRVSQTVCSFESRYGSTKSEELKLRAFADFLVTASAITDWQCDKLLQGRYKGFMFKDRYLILGHLEVKEHSSVFLAKDRLDDSTVEVEVFVPSAERRPIEYSVRQRDGA